MFQAIMITSLSAEEAELAHSRTDRTFIDANFEIYFEYKIITTAKDFDCKTYFKYFWD